VWKDKTKSGRILNGASWTIREDDEGNEEKFPETIYVEGTSLGNAKVKLEMLSPTNTDVDQNGKKLPSDTVPCCVVRPYWKGFAVKKKWQTKAVMCGVKPITALEAGEQPYGGDVSHEPIRTQYPDIVIGDGVGGSNSIPSTIFGKRGGGDNGESDNAESVKTFLDGFTLKLEYEYDPVGDDLSKCPPQFVVPGGYGYVPIKDGNAYPHKLSFVANSGVKFGTVNLVEAAILDVEKMVDMAKNKDATGNVITGINAFRRRKISAPGVIPEIWAGIDPNGVVRNITNSNITSDDEVFAPESVTRLMSHVMYGGDPATMKDYLDADDLIPASEYTDPNDPDINVRASWKKWWNTLRLNWERHGTKMKIDVAKSGVDFNVKISRRKSNNDTWEVSCEYSTGSLNFCDPAIFPRMYFYEIGKVYLQTHWHSGVRFTNAIGLE